jgi:hypothetical protein
MPHRIVLLTLCSAAALALLVACGGGGKGSTATPVSSPVASTPSPAGPTATAGPGSVTPISISISTPTTLDAPFGQTPVSLDAATGSPQVTLNRIAQLADSGAYDRVTFQFDGGLPGYHVGYLTSAPVGCASGQPVPITGQAFLEVRTTPAIAHTTSATPTAAETPQHPGLPAIMDLVQTCDYEGVVTWVLGLPHALDFRAFEIAPAFLVVDVKHP